MDRLRLTRTRPGTQESASGRDVLPFPKGGVFGPDAGKSLNQVEGAIDLARNIERTLNNMQLRLDELREELDDPQSFPFSSFGPDDSRPFAA